VVACLSYGALWFVAAATPKHLRFRLILTANPNSPPNYSFIFNHVSVADLCEIGGGHVLALGPQEGLQVLPQEETGPVHPRRNRPRPTRRSTLAGHNSALRSRAQRRLRQLEGIFFFILFLNFGKFPGLGIGSVDIDG